MKQPTVFTKSTTVAAFCVEANIKSKANQVEREG